MNSVWKKFKRFWAQEEIPRWIGMSLVAAYLLGLGAVTFVARQQSRQMAAGSAISYADHSVEMLTEVLGRTDPDDSAAAQLALLEFSRRIHCELLNVTNVDGVVLASIDAQQIGKQSKSVPQVAGGAAPSPGGPSNLTQGWAHNLPEQTSPSIIRRSYQIPFGLAGGETPRVLQAVVELRAAIGSTADHAWMLVTVLAALGALWMVYHTMRRHFRGVSCIADNLIAHADTLEQEFASLRLSDSMGAVAAGWNRLIDMVETLQAEVRRSKAATELREVLEKSGSSELANAVDAIPDGLIMIADEECIVHCNAAAARLMGWKPEELDRTRYADLETTETGKQILDVLPQARGRSGSYDGHTRLVESGTNIYRVRVVPIRKHQQHAACVILITDVSQQIRADRAREEFVSQVTHELRTPLTNIRAYSETLSSGMFDDPQVVTECYNVINKETRRLSRLIEDILSISQMEVGNMQMVVDEVDVRALIRDSVRDVRAAADEKNIDMQAVLPAKVDPITADRDKLAVVLNNLLGNAIKYTPAGGEVRVGCQVQDGTLLITVKDTGMGIAKEEQDLVFEKFHRSKNPDVQKEAGTGIGLTTAREIALRHGGDIELMSEQGKGSTFVVKLPMKRNATARQTVNV